MPVSVRPAGARHRALVNACEPLEPRRLLAVGMDPTFGGGDGLALLRSPFPFEDTNGEGVEVENKVFPHLISRLGGNYLVQASHLVLDADTSVAISAESVHALVTPAGAPSGALAKDSDGDGLAFFTQDEEISGGQFRGPDLFLDMAPLPDGSALVLEGAHDGLPARIKRILADGTAFRFFQSPAFDDIRAIEWVAPDVAALLTSTEVEDPVEPVGPDDLFYEVHLFDAGSGDLLSSDGVAPFGTWLRLDETQDPPSLTVGRDGALYVATETGDIDGSGGSDGGFLVARLLRNGDTLSVDQFGSTGLPGQTTPAAFFGAPAGGNFEFLGATSGRRAWIQVPDQSGATSKSFALLTQSGQLDSSFGDAGVVEVDFGPGGSGSLADGSPIFIAPGSLTQAPAPFVRGDGSLVGVMSVADSMALPPGGPFEFLVGVYGIMPDGSFDPRIAESGSQYGAGRAVIGVDVNGVAGAQFDQIQGFAYMDEAERIVIASENVASNGSTLDLMVSRILLNMPRAEIVDRPDGQRVFEIEGTTGIDRLVLRSDGAGSFQLFHQPVGGAQSIIGVFSAADVDVMEMMGGEGDDILYSELGTSFAGFVTISGGNGADTLFSNGRYSRLFGEEGNDTLLGGIGDQLIFGGAGNDSILGGSGRDALFGEDGDDILRGQLDGDFLDGGAGNDTLAGDENDDTLVGNLGDDSMIGGAGIDLVSYAGRAEAVSIRLGSGDNGPIAGFESDFIGDDVENALGGAGDDSIAGSDAANFLLGGAGNDTLLGLGGRDTLLAGPGSDQLSGGDGDDLLLDMDDLDLLSDPDTLLGGAGEDMGLVGSFATDTSDEEVELVFENLDELLALL